MDLEQWTSLEPLAFKQHLLDNCDTDDIYLVDLYNALIQKAAKEPARVAEMADVAVAALDSVGEVDGALLFLELHARCHLFNGDIDLAMAIISRIMMLNNSVAETTALELAQDTVMCIETFRISVDRQPAIFKQVESIFQHYGKHEKSADLRLLAALVYSGHGASQAAYRCIDDAEQVAHTLQLLPLLARCYGTALAVACEEPDYRWAIGAGENAIDVYSRAELEPPPGLLSNLGVAHLNLNELEQATCYFERALECTNKPDGLESAIQTNLSICLRRGNQLSQAEKMLADATSTAAEDFSEHSIELSLGAAKLASVQNDIFTLTRELQVSAKRLDGLLANVLRLHHRRGLRERYIVRLAELLRHLPSTGVAVDALVPVTATRGNAMADWLAILSWATSLRRDSNFPTNLADELDDILYQIRDLGAPHLFGFREKYDDPWSPGNFGGVWDDFSRLCSRISVLGFPSPLDQAGSSSQASLCELRLAQGHCLMFTTYSGESALLWCFIGENYHRVALPLKPMLRWYLAQIEHAQGSKNRSYFNAEINALIEVLSPLITPLFVGIADARCVSIRYIEDSLRELPLTLFVLRNAELAARMATGDFQVRIVPAMAEQLVDNSPLSAAVAIVDQREDLVLAPFEGAAFCRAAGISPPSSLSANNSESLTSLIGDHEILIVSTHGHSLNFFSDAYFAKLGSPDEQHMISVAALQIAAPDLAVRLAILNTCYSGSRSSRNFQKRFRTSDAVAIPNLFLLNQRAVALAGAWKISDTASFVIAYLVGDALRQGHEPAAAVAMAIARLPAIKRSATVSILADNLPEAVRDKALPRLTTAPEDGMFSHPYFTAGLSLYGLL
jgi:tetratricopeptide (TPR) repeat protein